MNKLEKETSPYLLEHKNNPVDWHAWNHKTLEKAKKKNKPILLSIGYSSCHWCHVMARESFQNNKIAGLMNEYFINIKVDREERPDLDFIYQNALQVFGEQGGWPLTMFLTPQLEPFWGGTYFPPVAKFGRPAFPEILKNIYNIFKKEKEKIKKSVILIKKAIIENTKTIPGPNISSDLSKQVSLSLINLIDKQNGGIKGAPKFPNVPIFKNILKFSFLNGLTIKKQDDTGIYQTLNKMCLGGIYDHVGGGFSRYSTDENWLVPHFEKMLYDNAQLIELLIYGYQIYREPMFKNRIFETIEWALREMKTKYGGFASAIDADSEGEEGKFYVWKKDEIKKILKNNADEFCRTYNVSSKGNWENKNILNLKIKRNSDQIKKDKILLHKLFKEREKRISPNLDDKILTDCNGLMINALAYAGWVFNEKKWLDESENTYNFIIKNLIYKNELFHSWKNRKIKTFATLDDYANLMRCSITLFTTTSKKNYLDNAENFAETIIKKFKDKNNGGFYTTSNKTIDVLTKLKSTYDSAIPSGIGLTIQSFAKLFYLTGKNYYSDEANIAIKSIVGNVQKNFFSSASLIDANDLLNNGIQIILVEEGEKRDTLLLNKIKQFYLPNIIFQKNKNSTNFPKGHPAHGKKTKDKKSTIYICKNQKCSLPITSSDEFEKIQNINNETI